MGQGLNLVKSIVQDYNGELKVKSDTGKYFRLEMTLLEQKSVSNKALIEN